MDRSIFDITNPLLPVFPLCSDPEVNQKQADYLRPIILNVLVAVSNPLHYPRLEQDMQSWDPQGRDIFIRLHRHLQPALIQHSGILLTILEVSATPVNYQITIGHGV